MKKKNYNKKMKTFPIPHPLPPLHPFYPHKIVFSVTPVMQLKLPSCRRSFVKPIEKTRRTAPLVRQSVDNNNNDNDNDNDDNDNDDKKNKKCNSGYFFSVLVTKPLSRSYLPRDNSLFWILLVFHSSSI